MVTPKRFDVVKVSDPMYMRDGDGQHVRLVVDNKEGEQLVLVFPHAIGDDLFWKITVPPASKASSADQLISLSLHEGSYGWTWTVRDEDGIEREYLTSARGDGLYFRTYPGTIEQKKGEMQSRWPTPCEANLEAMKDEICRRWGISSAI